ncbi:PEGA domain-containing protein [Desulfovibrio sp. JC022]|uniref:PEGA domain-containing protein n=1 Tax=Desulfovibrio sp. JC022 TaxID=2593642 RepID=UPI0013D31C62|nr:PEGA domain-containing protein [Desulfovibrio sp. JC022]NDV21666.1 PEGA domain-containing protein [Desulfovibrio sp. JC022]
MKKRLLAIFCGLAVTAGCAPVIKTQSIPVSTNPMGATVYADGKVACTSPCTVDLPRNAEHIITVKKDQYRQQDVIIKRVYQQEKVMMKAVSQGMQSSSMAVGSGGDKTAWGMMQGVNSIDSQEQTGDAYVLAPSAVSVRLVPLTAQAQYEMTGSTAPDMQSLTTTDRAQISYILETMKSGTDFNWTNSQTGIKYDVKAGSALPGYDSPTRSFILQMTAHGQTSNYDAKASRVGQGKWNILGNGVSTSMLTDDGSGVETSQPATMNSDTFVKDAVKAGAMAAPTIHGGVTAKGGSSSEGWDGNTYTKKSSETKVKAGVSVNPAQAIEVLDMLTNDKK